MKKGMPILIVLLLLLTVGLGVATLAKAYREVDDLVGQGQQQGSNNNTDQGGSSTDQGGSSTDQGGSSTDQGGSSTDQGGSSTDQGGSDTEPIEPEKIEWGDYSYYTDNCLSLIDGTYTAVDNEDISTVSQPLLQVRADNGELYVEKGWQPEAGCNVPPPFANFTVERWESFAFFYRVYDASEETWSDYRMVTGDHIGLWYYDRRGDIVSVTGRVEISPMDDMSGGTYDLYFEIPPGSEVYGNIIRLYCFHSS